MAEMNGSDDTPAVPPATAWVKRIADSAGVLRLEIGGDLDISSTPSVRTVLAGLLEDAPTRVVVDVRELQFLDSSGIALLLLAARVTGTVEIEHARPIVRRVIEVSGLAEVLRLAS
jgi:anti-sigma B factor antagonist